MTDLAYLAIAVIVSAAASAALTWRMMAKRNEADLERMTERMGEQLTRAIYHSTEQGIREAELREKNYILRQRIESIGVWVPRAFIVEWDTRNFAMSGVFISANEDGLKDLVQKRELGGEFTINKIEEVGISEPVMLQSSGWNHDFIPKIDRNPRCK